MVIQQLLYYFDLCVLFIKFIRIRVPYPFQWGAPSFDAGEAFAMMMTAFVALVEVCFLFSVSIKSQEYH